MNVVSIYRHPVKGLRPEALDGGQFIPGRGLVGDRAFAFQFLDEAVAKELRDAPEQNAPWMSKFNLVMQHDWPEIARIVPKWVDESGVLKLDTPTDIVEGSVEKPEGRSRLAEFMSKYLASCTPYEKARHPQLAPLRLIGNVNLQTRYTDGDAAPVSFAGAATFDDLSARLGLSVDYRRFRLNLILSGIEPWAELKWSGKKLRIGQCVLEVKKPLGRCANIDVHPETGERDATIYQKLKPTYGHALTGMRADVLQAGEIRIGDSWEFIG